jgi:hypothetical protein
MRWTGQIARIEEMRGHKLFWSENHRGKANCGERRRREDTIKVDFNEKGREYVERIHLR